MSVLSLRNVSFAYTSTLVLKDLSYEFEKGKIYCISGKSGAGKTTLLSILSGLAQPTSGDIYFNEKNITSIDTYELRSKYLGVIFQSYNLLTKFTAIENVILSMDIANVKGISKIEKAKELLTSVGLNEDEMNRRVLHLSGGQQQRVAIARALSFNPDIILADEPTGNLDPETEKEIMDIFKELANNGKCIIIVSHSQDVANMCDIKYNLIKQK